MSDPAHWIELVDRERLLLLTAEGPYVRYGMPRYVTIRRSGPGYDVEWNDAGDGAGVPASGKQRVDRDGLERFLRQLCDDGRPVWETGAG
jgi:hypothetical protein